jgi:hypothetical protein
MPRWKKRYGYRASDDDRLIARRALLMTLIKLGPQPMETLIAAANRKCGFSPEDVLEAARWWNLHQEDRDGVIYWSKPEVLAILPKWNYQRVAA